MNNTQENEFSEIINHLTLGDAVLDKIRNAILEGKLEPGEKLDQGTLASKFGTSRMPVRDALRQLQYEGFVKGGRGRGIFVVGLNLTEAQQIYEVRILLENYATLKAIENGTNEDVKILTSLLKKTEAAARNDDIPSMLQLDHEFHQATYQPCGNPFLLKMISDLMHMTWSYRIKVIRLPGQSEKMLASHRALYEAFTSKNVEAFDKTLKEHLSNTVNIIVDLK